MFIGDPNLFIGSSSWYIGSISLLPEQTDIASTGDYLDSWIFRDSSGKVIRELDFGYAEPGTTISTSITAEYRGYDTIRVHGFYISDVPESIYSGLKAPSIDKAEIIRWADWYTGDAYFLGAPGMELAQIDWDSQTPVVDQVRSGQGDTEDSLINFVGVEGGILQRDRRFPLTISINIPSAETKQITRAMKLNFGIEISFSKVLAPLLENISGDSC